MTAAASSEPQSFDLTAPLPPGTTSLEASAGTGKTYAIVGIAARAIADGLPIDKLLLVTFSRSATAELRERMRERLTSVAEALDTGTGPGDDVLAGLLLAAPAADRDRARERLVRALSDFDASTIATTHTFCSRMLEALGFLGERELFGEIVEDVDDLVEQTALDLYLWGFAGATDGPAFTLTEAMTIAKEAVRNPGVALAPDLGNGAGAATADDAVAARRVGFARKVRELVTDLKQISRLRTYDDLQTILHAVVTDEQIGPDACRRIRDSFELVLVDEFQDTDPFQWEILRRCFHGHRRLVLVGDPKQSIYAFRGAEVLSYLDAVRIADNQRALDTNYRSDADLVDALYRIYGGANLGHPQITVRPVRAARIGSRLRGAPALRVRWFANDDFPVKTTAGEFAAVADVRAAVYADVGADIARLLASDATVDGHPVHPGDIAVLVAKNKTIEPLQEALAAHGIASVVGAGASVFSTMAARHWLWLLRAIEQPAVTNLVGLAALTPLIGWSPERLAAAGDTEITGLAAELADLARVFGDGGFAAMAARVLATRQVAARVLGTVDGERLLTDLSQIATVCNRHAVEADCGLSAVREWLAERIADVSHWRRSQEQTRRLDRDTHVVQIMTVHASKGLQFPIVYVPFGWDATRPSTPQTFRYHDESGDRYLDVGGLTGTGRAERLRRSSSEDSGEELRKLYVALTRAASQVVLWWAPSTGTAGSALHRVLFGHPPGYMAVGTSLPESEPVPDPGACASRLRLLGAGTDTISVEEAGGPVAPRWTPPAATADPPALAAATFTDRIDRGWRRTSYSAIIAGAAHGPAVGSEPEEPGIDDESTDEAPPIAAPDSRSADVRSSPTASLMNGMPFGATFGTLVHEVLEYVDTSAPDRAAHVRELCERSAGRYAAGIDVDALAAALDAVLTTPLGFGDLWGIGPADRLAELDFELPLGAPGETRKDCSAGSDLSGIAAVMRAHLRPDDPLLPYADVLAGLPAQRLRGFLTGSIDSVLRTPAGRFVIVDYKTNRLRPGDLDARDFSADALAAEMIRSHYPLQAMLYSVALHRYLRWRGGAAYRPDTYLGPVQYHFVRGMIGPATPPGCGVFEWDMPPEMVIALSDLLAGGAR
ncbi:MAG: UvrD-helicase domain-containing protein [Gordonia sp. (in: high G+C Gram-positive bacteria)]